MRGVRRRAVERRVQLTDPQAIEAARRLVDNDTRGMDKVRRRVCEGCARAPLIPLGRWASKPPRACEVCGQRVASGLIVIDIARLNIRPG